MSMYIGYNSLKTPKFQRRDHGTSSSMSGHLDREGHFSDSYVNSFFTQGAADKDLFRKTYSESQMTRCAKDVSFYPDEFNWMLSQMNVETPENKIEDALVKLLNVSELADEALFTQHETNDTVLGDPRNKVLGTMNIIDLLHWKQFQDQKHERFMLHEQAMQDRDDKVLSSRNRVKNRPRSDHIECSTLKSMPKLKSNLRTRQAVVKAADKRKTKLKEKKPNCWHYMRGHCKRGKYCDFNHDKNHSYPDSFKVFLGGLPFHITEACLKQQLSEQGFHVVNKPKVYGGFSPQVCLATAAEAQRLITMGSIKISGMTVDVRCYEAFTKKNQDKLEDISCRSVFLGGLRKGTTPLMIKRELLSLGLKIVNYPLIKEGFSPQVTLATPEQARKLVNLMKVQINGASVDVRPHIGVGSQLQLQP